MLAQHYIIHHKESNTYCVYQSVDDREIAIFYLLDDALLFITALEV